MYKARIIAMGDIVSRLKIQVRERQGNGDFKLVDQVESGSLEYAHRLAMFAANRVRGTTLLTWNGQEMWFRPSA